MSNERPATGRVARGFTLIETIVFVIVLGVGVMGALAAVNQAVIAAGEPMFRKQASALAESVLEEVLARSFAANPLTPAVDPAVDSSAAGTNPASRTQPHDVDDYHGMDMTTVRTIDGLVIAALASYRVRVSVTAAALGGGAAPAVPSTHSKLVAVRVTGPAGTDLTVHGYKINGPGL